MITEFSKRKTEISTVFKQVLPLPSKAREKDYEDILARIGVANSRDLGILTTIVNDKIMMAMRLQEPDSGLEDFMRWLVSKQVKK